MWWMLLPNIEIDKIWIYKKDVVDIEYITGYKGNIDT